MTLAQTLPKCKTMAGAFVAIKFGLLLSRVTSICATQISTRLVLKTVLCILGTEVWHFPTHPSHVTHTHSNENQGCQVGGPTAQKFIWGLSQVLVGGGKKMPTTVGGFGLIQIFLGFYLVLISDV